MTLSGRFVLLLALVGVLGFAGGHVARDMRPASPRDKIEGWVLHAQDALGHDKLESVMSECEKLWAYLRSEPGALATQADNVAVGVMAHAEALTRLGRFEEAAAVLGRLLGPDDMSLVAPVERHRVVAALMLQSYCYRAAGHEEKARAALRRMVQRPFPWAVGFGGLKRRIERSLREDKAAEIPDDLRALAVEWKNRDASAHPGMFGVGTALVRAYMRADMPIEARLVARDVLARLNANRAAWTGTGPGAESTARQDEITLLSDLQTSAERIGIPQWSIEAMERLILLEKDPRGAANLRQQIEHMTIGMVQPMRDYQDPERTQR